MNMPTYPQIWGLCCMGPGNEARISVDDCVVHIHKYIALSFLVAKKKNDLLYRFYFLAHYHFQVQSFP